MIGTAKTGYVCINYTCLENGTFLDHCLRQICSVHFICFLIDLSTLHKNFINTFSSSKVIATKLKMPNFVCRYVFFTGLVTYYITGYIGTNRCMCAVHVPESLHAYIYYLRYMYSILPCVSFTQVLN